jgi:hypothetical protein
MIIYWCPLARGPVESLAIFDDLVETAHDFLDWCLLVEPVSENQIDVIKLEPLQCSVSSLNYVFA